MNSNPSRPIMFPCATQVSLIEVGADDFDAKLKVRDQAARLSNRASHQLPFKSRKGQERVAKPVIERVSAGLTFTDEVVRHMAPYTIPYNEQSIYDAYDTSEFLSQAEKKMNLPGGRFNNYGPDRRHMSCYFKKTAPYKLKPIKRQIMKRALEMHKQALQKEEQMAAEEGSTELAEEQKPGFFITENIKRSPAKKTPGGRCDPAETERAEQEDSTDTSATKPHTESEEKHQWDEYLLSILSRPTAQWIVTQRTDPTDHRFKPLFDYMVDKHGAPTSTELVRDNMAEYEDEPKPKPEVKAVKKRPNTQSARLLQPVYDMESSKDEEELDTVPYSDTNQASFYRKPGGIKKQIKIQQKEMGALNTTATTITVKKQELPPPPKLRDFVDPRITENTVYETDNNFQRDWLTGNKQVYQAFGDENEIVMENHNKYNKVSQVQYPRDSTEWCADGSIKPQDADTSDALVHKISKGQQRWTGLPKPVEESSAMIAGVVEEMEQSMNPSVEKFQPSEALSKIVDEWRAKWHLNMRFDDATPEELIKDMEDIHPHVRIKAISTCARATAYKPPPLEGIQLFSVKQSEKSKLPEQIFVALNCLLEDDHPRVRLASAISLHALQRPNELAEQILRDNLLPEQNKADRWAAVQCLGFYGVTDSDVIGEVVAQMMNNENMILYEKACALLAHISNSTDEYGQKLVHSMLAEHLNDCSWRHRVMALKCLPKLYGDINIDIQNKVMHIMWNDSHSDVRKAAAQSLGKCGYGRLVHDKLREILIEGTQSERADTLSKIGFLGIMTAKLMLPFMRAFRDEYVAVRKEACIAAGNLRIKDDGLISELLRLSNRDPIWRIKALAIQALGKIGVVIPEVREALLWALRFEEEEGVRAEACHSIILLQLKDKYVLDILQNRMLVEESPVVQEELAVALEFNGVSATEDMAMVAQIKAEVRKLSNRNDIYNSICVLEKEEEIAENTKQMIYIPPAAAVEELRQPEEDEEMGEGDETLDQMADQQEPARLVRPLSHSMITVSEPILEVDEGLEAIDGEVSSTPQHSRQHSARSKLTRSRQTSGKSRPASGYSSLNTSGKSRPASGYSSLSTDAIDTELENIAKDNSKRDSGEATECGSTPQQMRRCTESRASSGYEKKRLSRMRAVSVTPTVLSVSMDQIEAIHSDTPTLGQRLEAMSVTDDGMDENVSTPLSQVKRAEPLGSSSSPTTAPEILERVQPPSGVAGDPPSEGVHGGEGLRITDSMDPVDVKRVQNTNFLFDRYSHIDIKSPQVLSPETSDFPSAEN